jgi:hypothetical protein
MMFLCGEKRNLSEFVYEFLDICYPEAFSRKWGAEGDWDG